MNIKYNTILNIKFKTKFKSKNKLIKNKERKSKNPLSFKYIYILYKLITKINFNAIW